MGGNFISAAEKTDITGSMKKQNEKLGVHKTLGMNKKKTTARKKAVGTALFPVDDAAQSSQATSTALAGKPATFAGQALL